MNNIISLPILLQELKGKFPENISENAFIEAFTSTIIDGLKSDGKVEIKGLGVFQLLNSDSFEKKKSADLIKFIPDKETADIVNQPFAFFEAVELDDEVTEDTLNVSEFENIENNADETSDSVNSNDTQIQYDSIEDGDIISPDEPQNPNSGDILDQIQEDVFESSEQTTNSEGTIKIEENNIKIHNEQNNLDSTDEYTNNSYLPIESETTIENDSSGKSWLLLLTFFIMGLIIGYLIPTYVVNTTPKDVLVQHDTVYVNVTPIVPDSIQDISDTLQIQVVDTIKTNRFLATMARNHYGRMEFWVYIYLENKDKISNPNHIPLGTTVVIPPASKYGIDPHSQSSIDEAERKCTEVLNAFSK